MSDDSRKLTGIRQIMSLKQLLKYWQPKTLGNDDPKPISTAGESSKAVDTKLEAVIDQNCSSAAESSKAVDTKLEAVIDQNCDSAAESSKAVDTKLEAVIDQNCDSAAESSKAVDTKLEAVIDQNCDSDEDRSHSPEPPPDVPRGYLPVKVGQEKRRFVIPISYLSSPFFTLLLEKAEEEFGFNYDGVLTLPCEIEAFNYILQLTQQHQKGLISDEGKPADKKE